MGLWLIDNGNLEELAQACAARGRWEFLFTVAPLRLQHTTGSPSRLSRKSSTLAIRARRSKRPTAPIRRRVTDASSRVEPAARAASASVCAVTSLSLYVSMVEPRQARCHHREMPRRGEDGARQARRGEGAAVRLTYPACISFVNWTGTSTGLFGRAAGSTAGLFPGPFPATAGGRSSS